MGNGLESSPSTDILHHAAPAPSLAGNLPIQAALDPDDSLSGFFYGSILALRYAPPLTA